MASTQGEQSNTASTHTDHMSFDLPYRQRKDEESSASSKNDAVTPGSAEAQLPLAKESKTHTEGDATPSNDGDRPDLSSEATTEENSDAALPAPPLEPSYPEWVTSSKAGIKLDAVQRAVIYRRHKLQRAFLHKVHMPSQSEVEEAAIYFDEIEEANVPPHIADSSKIYKVFNAIAKQEVVPGDEKHRFKERSVVLYEDMKARIETDPVVAERRERSYRSQEIRRSEGWQ